jgi:hypothetical protein
MIEPDIRSIRTSGEDPAVSPVEALLFSVAVVWTEGLFAVSLPRMK